MRHLILFSLLLPTTLAAPCADVRGAYHEACCGAAEGAAMVCPAACYEYEMAVPTTEGEYAFLTHTTARADYLVVYIGDGSSFQHPFGDGLSEIPDAAALSARGVVRARDLGNIGANVLVAAVQPSVSFGDDFNMRFANTIESIRGHAPTARVVLMGYSLGTIFAMGYLDYAAGHPSAFSDFELVYVQSPSLVPGAIGGLGVGFPRYADIFRAHPHIPFAVYTHVADPFLGPSAFGWTSPSAVADNLAALRGIAAEEPNVHLVVLDETTADPHGLGMRLFEQGVHVASTEAPSRPYALALHVGIGRPFSSACRASHPDGAGVLTYVHTDATLPLSQAFRYDFDCATKEMTAWTLLPGQGTNVSLLTSSSASAVNSVTGPNVRFRWSESEPGVLTFGPTPVVPSDWPLNVIGSTAGVDVVEYPGFRLTSMYRLEPLGPPKFYSGDALVMTDSYPPQQAGTAYIQV